MPAILIVDDEQKMREFVALFLRSSRYTVFEAADGRTALNILSKETIDLGLTVIRNYFKLITVSRWIQVC